MKKIKINWKKDLKMLFFSIFTAIIEGFAQTTFVLQGGFYPSGLAGFCRLISNILEIYISPTLVYSILYFLINLILAIIVFKEIGKKFTLFTLLQTSLVSLFISKLPCLIVIDDIMLLSIFGGIVNGLAVGLALANDLSSGGTDFLNVFFSKKYNKSILNYIFYFNVVLYICAGLLNGWEIAMYSIIFSFCTTQIVKLLHKRYTHETLTIITKYPDNVINNILKNVRHGITIFNGKGAYLHQDETMLYTVINTFQTQQVIKAVLEADPHAFINVQASKKVVGNYYQLPLD